MKKQLILLPKAAKVLAELVENIKLHMECPPSEVKIDHYLQLDYLPGGIAVMTLYSFSNEQLDKTKENFAEFLAASFKELKMKGINKPVTDLR